MNAQAQGGGRRGKEAGEPSARAQSLGLREETIRKVEELERMRAHLGVAILKKSTGRNQRESGHWITAELISAELSQ